MADWQAVHLTLTTPVAMDHIFSYFLGHIIAGIMFTLLGLWWFLNTIYLLLEKNKEQRQYFLTKTWFPSSILFGCTSATPFEPGIKIVLSVFGVIEELISNHWTLYVNGELAEDNVRNLTHVTMYAFLGLIGMTEILLELKLFQHYLPQSLSHFTLFTGFAIEGILSVFHIDYHLSSLHTNSHVFLSIIMFVCAAAVALEGWLKPSAHATMLRAYVVTLQGTCICQIAFTEFGPNRWNKKNPTSGMLIPTVFAWHVLGIFLLFLTIHLVVCYLEGRKSKKNEAGLLSESSHDLNESQDETD